MHEPLNNDTYILYCAKNYNNPHCSGMTEFLEDLNRIKYIKKLVTRYIVTKDLRERLILNHIITLYNVFGPQATARILYFKLREQFKYIKPFLILLNILPDKLYNINNVKVIDMDQIEMDQHIVETLRKI